MQSLASVEDGREPRLDVHHAVPVHVLDHFVGDPLEGLLGLHHATGVRESFQVQRQTATLCAAVKPPGQLASVGCRKRLVVLIPGKLDRRLRPQTPVEMVVQEDLGQGLNEHRAIVRWPERRMRGQLSSCRARREPCLESIRRTAS